MVGQRTLCYGGALYVIPIDQPVGIISLLLGSPYSL